MNARQAITCAATAVFCAACFSAAARAEPPAVFPRQPEIVFSAAANCYSAGQKVAAEKGGQLAKAVPQTRGGKTVCVVVVLVPGKGGERPRRAEMVVPAD